MQKVMMYLSFLIVGLSFFMTDAHAEQLIKLNPQVKQTLKMPTLGDARLVEQSNKNPFNVAMELAVLRQNSSGYDALAIFVGIILIAGFVAAIVELTATIFNIIGLANQKGHLGFGITAIIMSSIFLSSFLIALASATSGHSSDLMITSILILSTQVPILTLGILSVITHAKYKKRQKRKIAFSPWINVTQMGDFQGGLAFVGTF